MVCLNSLIVAVHLFKVLEKKSVWFMIHEQYGRYKIIMYYDNEYNHSNGEDL